MRLRHGSREHSLGGKIHEVYVGDRLAVSWTSMYDHIEDLHYALKGSVLVCFGASHAVGWIRSAGQFEVYVAVGSLSLSVPEPDEFETLHPGAS